MVTIKPLDNNLLSKHATEQLGRPHFCSQGTKIPNYCFGTQYLVGNEGLSCMSEEEQTLLDSLLLAQWEGGMWKGHFRYDVTASEIKIVGGRRKFLAQLNDRNTVCSQYPEKSRICHQEDLHAFDLTKQCEELLFCITNSDKANSELIPSADVPNTAIFIMINVNPIEYGHIFLVPHGFDNLYLAKGGRMSRILEMVERIAIEINNFSFHLFYDYPGPTSSQLEFQACYFPELLPVERMPVDLLFGDRCRRISISTVLDYPIKTLIFESNCNFKILVEVLAETISFLLDEGISYNLMISDHGKKIFLFLQAQTFSSYCISAWECGGYFLFRSRQEFDQVTEADLLKRLTSVSLDDESFVAVKQICCGIVSKTT
ncbi:GDP-L-galactose phosphorylase 2-like [Euphorbia lathyris]|uniref:GDP-L-galactose phosphorylase 2-like n=1 Tax=Euphorbia lathyris TaxID=212925 RepID=UPI003313490A